MRMQIAEEINCFAALIAAVILKDFQALERMLFTTHMSYKLYLQKLISMSKQG